MRFFKIHTTPREVYVWYNADLDKCVSGTMDEYNSSRLKSRKTEDFQIICQVGNDRKVIQELTSNINKSID